MKKLNPITQKLYYVILVGIFVVPLSGCFGEKYEIKSAKVSSPEEVSNSCSQNLGLSESEMKQLANELENNDSKFNDEFKLQAMIIITESKGVPPEESKNAQAAYFSCIQNYIDSGASK